LDIRLLREQTRQDHERVEGVMPLMHPDLDRHLYTTVLCRLVGIVAAWEQSIESRIPEKLLGFVRERSRLRLLEEDLRDLGVSAVDLPRPLLPIFDNLAELLGAMYVMEGSRLGGQLIARHVESALNLSAGNGSRYFRGFGNQTGQRWSEFVTLLEGEIPDEASTDAVRGAKKMFSTFGAWMKA
jgi:heme oxygenase (biliverdin-IX-beta and delta-forming)